MNWRFTIINRNSVTTVVEEPVGWDALKIKIERDLEKHGVFFDYSENDLEFVGKAFQLLQQEYNAFGSQGKMSILIEWGCDSEYTPLYTGTFLFADYKEYYAGYCYCKMPIEISGDVMTLRNRWDQVVDLQTTKAFDQSTNLDAYSALPLTVQLPSKSIRLRTDGKMNGESVATGNFALEPTWGINSSNNIMRYTIQIGFPNNNPLEIERSFLPDVLIFQGDGFNNRPPVDMPPLIERINSFELACSSETCFFSTRIKGSVAQTKTAQPTVPFFNAVVYLIKLPAGADPNNTGNYITIFNSGFIASGSGDHTSNFDFSINTSFSLNVGDKVWFNIFGQVTAPAAVESFVVTMHPDSFVTLYTDSICEPSPAKLFLAHEAWSRTAEAITNDQLRVYSRYFGRTDSQPYSYAQDGPGSLEALSKGLFVRRVENRIPGQPAVMGVSMQSLWDGLNPVHNIGIGIESDPTRPGKNRIRIEDWKHFYSNNVLLQCTGIERIELSAVQSELISTIEIGYQKWEAEQFNGLDELLTKRSLRTTLSSIQNKLSLLSSMITSGYAIEITRRIGNTESKDWRYDNEVFLFCLKRDNGNLVVDLGNAINTENIYDPSTLYNYRISPMRNALRWLNRLLTTYRQLNSDAKLIFMDGEGNYFAKGELQDAFAKLEAGVLAENEELTISDLASAAVGEPFARAERVSFRYPLSVADFKSIQANNNGLIYYESGPIQGYGWIDSITYTPNEGLAQFKLIPKIPE